VSEELVAGLGALVRAQLVLRHLNEAVHEVFAVTALTSLFEIQQAAEEPGR